MATRSQISTLTPLAAKPATMPWSSSRTLFRFWATNFLSGFAEEGPIFIGIVNGFHLNDLKRVVDFGGHEETVLIANVERSAFQVDENPTTADWGAECTFDLSGT